MSKLGPMHRLRSMRPSDRPYLTVSWLAEAVRSATYSGIDRDLAFNLLRPHVNDLLNKLFDKVVIVCPSEEDEPIEAFAVADGPILYHLHVKGPFRGQGLMTSLLNKLGFPIKSTIICATDTRDLNSIMSKGKYNITLRNDLLLIPRD